MKTDRRVLTEGAHQNTPARHLPHAASDPNCMKALVVKHSGKKNNLRFHPVLVIGVRERRKQRRDRLRRGLGMKKHLTSG